MRIRSRIIYVRTVNPDRSVYALVDGYLETLSLERLGNMLARGYRAEIWP